MKATSPIRATVAAVSLFSALHLQADNFTTTTNAGAGSDWTTAAAGWSSGLGASAGNTYEALSGALVRSPRNSGPTVTFPGTSLQIDSGAAMRFKNGDVGPITTFMFNDGGFILNGGQAQAGDSINSTVGGFVHVLSDSSLTTSGPLTVLDTPGHPAVDTRTFNISAIVDGAGLLTLMNGKTSITNPNGNGSPDFTFTGINTSFSGGFNNVGGWLQVAGTGSLGSGNVVINGFDASNQAIFSSTVDLTTSGTLTLSNINSGIILNQNLTFSAITINGSSLPAGSYNTDALIAMGFGANIAGGSDSSKFLTVAAIPEPSTAMLFMMSGLCVFIFHFKRSRRA